jgi:hypothetical protein
MLQVPRIFNQADQGGEPGASADLDPLAPIPRGEGKCMDIIFDYQGIVITTRSRCTAEELALIEKVVKESFEKNP